MLFQLPRVGIGYLTIAPYVSLRIATLTFLLGLGVAPAVSAQAQTTELISTNAEGEAASGFCRAPRVFADGRYVSFVCRAGNLAEPFNRSGQQAFVKDRLTGQVQLVSQSTDGHTGGFLSSSLVLDISADGRFVLFTSSAYGLAPDDINTNGSVEDTQGG